MPPPPLFVTESDDDVARNKMYGRRSKQRGGEVVIRVEGSPMDARLSLKEVALDPIRANYAILGGIVVLFALLLTASAKEHSPFLHFGPGTKPENTASFLHMKIDNWTIWSLVMLLSTLYVVLQQWRNSVIVNFKTQQVKSLRVGYEEACRNVSGDCDATIGVFAVIDAFNLIIMSIIPILLFTTKQLQFMLPAILMTTVIGAWGTIHYFQKKDGHPSA